MNWKDLRKRLRRFDRNAEIIFDSGEPIGAPTDLVLPRRRWFRHTPVDSLEEKVLQAAQQRKS